MAASCVFEGKQRFKNNPEDRGVFEVKQQFINNLEDSNIGVTKTKPKFPQYAVATKRKDSFKMWPEYLPLNPDVLVDAGLVYTGVGDSVRCFYCGGGLRNWERGDSPWEEHAKWYPSCPYVHLVKGQSYVERVKRGDKPELDLPPKREVSESEYDPINSVAAQACIQMGYSEDLVKKAITIYVKKSGGKLNFKAKDLCQIIFDIEDQQNEIATNTALSAVSNEIQVPQNIPDSKPEKSDVEMQDEEDDDETVEELVEENRRLKENQQCKICLDDLASVIFLPCGHMVSCPQCAPALQKCPICRVAIRGVVKAYFATN